MRTCISLLTAGLLCASLLGGAEAPARRVILVDIDGVGRNTFEEAYLGRRLPNFERILGPVSDSSAFAHALRFTNATAVFPTLTMSGQASIFTGVYPGKHGVVGNEWFDRSRGRLVDYMSGAGVACVYGFVLLGSPECAAGIANRHLETSTVYEAASQAGKSTLVVFSHYWRGSGRVVLPSLPEALAFLQGGSVDYEAFDTRMMDHVVEELTSGGMPDLLTLYFAGADAVAPERGANSQVAYLGRVIDVQIGRLLDALETLDPAWRDSTLFVVIADHGRTEVDAAPDDHLAKSRILDALARAGYDSSRSQLAVNGGMAHLYLRSRFGDEPWPESPPFEDVLRAAQEIHWEAQSGLPVEFILVRTPENGYQVYAETEAGQPQLQPLPEEIAVLVSGLDNSRSGGILIVLKEGHYFLSQPGGFIGEHGGIHASDLAVPLILARGGITAGHSAAAVGTVNLAKTIADYLGFAMEGVEPGLPPASSNPPAIK